jgi:hypothetical protein
VNADITPSGAVMELAKIARQLDELGYKLRDAERAAVNKEHAYRVAKAKAYLAIDEGTIPEREYQTVLATENERLSAKLAGAELSILRREISICETRIEVGRSVVGVLRAEAMVAG